MSVVLNLLEKVEQSICELNEHKTEVVQVSLDFYDLIQIRKGLLVEEELRKQLMKNLGDQIAYQKKHKET